MDSLSGVVVDFPQAAFTGLDPISEIDVKTPLLENKDFSLDPQHINIVELLEMDKHIFK